MDPGNQWSIYFERLVMDKKLIGSPNNGQPVKALFYHLSKSNSVIKLPRSTYWCEEEEFYFIHWEKVLISIDVDGSGEIASLPWPILHSFGKILEVKDHLEKNLDVYSLQRTSM